MWQTFSNQGPKTEDINYSKFVAAADSGEVASVTIKKGNEISGTFLD